ncbi:innexin unc-9-like [Argonauta hians]
MISKTLKIAKTWFIGSGDDDFTDKLNHIYTVTVLLIFTVVVSSGTYIKRGISCWRPEILPKSEREFIETSCWIGKLYYIPDDGSLSEIEEASIIHYYLWIPIILIFQAFLFKAPNYFWLMLHRTSGLNVDKLVQISNDVILKSESERYRYVKEIGSYLHKWISVNRKLETRKLALSQKVMINLQTFTINKHRGTYLSGIYLTSKVWYVANAVVQYFLISYFLKNEFISYGSKHIQNTNLTAHYFPRTAYCVFPVRHQDAVLKIKVRCLLPINVLNEKIFIFLWFWFSFVAILSSLSLVLWIYRLQARQSYINFVFKFLKSKGYGATTRDKVKCEIFADLYLKNDGILALRLIGKNSSHFLLSDVVEYLWNIQTNERSYGLMPLQEMGYDLPMQEIGVNT